MTVVSDASAIIALSAIGALHLIHRLYETVFIPDAVYEEVVDIEETKPGVRELLEASWITTRAVTNLSLIRALKENLGDGEAEAITLAVEMDADLVLMDERRGRKVAQRQGLSVIGVLGILVESRRKGLIPELKPLLQALRTAAGFHISPQLYDSVLRAVDEAP